MAINQNHLFEDLDGVKCAIVEKNASQKRVDFLKPLLELNGYTVIIANSPPPKSAPVAQVEGSTPAESAAPAAQSTFTIGVTDVRFNATNAIFGRLLKTIEGRVVTLAYWQQKESVSEDTVPYFSK
jgi:hypothetical protein